MRWPDLCGVAAGGAGGIGLLSTEAGLEEGASAGKGVAGMEAGSFDSSGGSGFWSDKYQSLRLSSQAR